MTSRLASMDSQRYDLSKRRSCAVLSIMTRATSGHVDRAWSPQTFDDSWQDQAAPTPYNSLISSPASSETSLPSIDLQTFIDSAATTPPNVSTTSITLENTSAPLCDTEKDEYAATCDILRPVPRSSILDFLSGNLTHSMLPTSPTSLKALNCFGSIDAFEDEVSHFQHQRSNELAGKSDIRIFVTRETDSHREELWRGQVQELLYGNQSIVNTRSIVRS